MLQSLELENFKAFGERARIPFAPITLIFGENSAGKSTILQALNLLKQTRESRETGALLLPRAENGIVDLGSFQEMVFDHDLERTLSIRVETKADRQLAVEFSFKRPSFEEEVLLDQIEVYYGEPSICVAKFQPSDVSEEIDELSIRIEFLIDSLLLDPSFRDSRGLPPSKLVAVKCVWLTEEPGYWRPEFEWCKERKEKILSRLKEMLNERKHSNDESQEDDGKLQEELSILNNDIDFFLSDFDLGTYISKRHKEEMTTVLGLQGFLPVGVISGERKPWITGLRLLLNRESDNPGSDDGAFDVVQLAMLAGRTLEQTLEVLFPMGPFRKPPERWYIFRGTSPQDVGYRGDLLPDLLFRHPELVEEANEWLKHLDMGYELEKVKPVGPDWGDLFALRLIDTRRNERVNVALSDVGFGISQLLPFVVQSLVPGKRIISIEQPEVHVHPRLQADLGDLLAEVIIKEPRLKQFIIETHSEHLILRLQRLVREKKIKPTDISVIYVSRGPEGAEAQRLHLDEDGDFIDDWPKGFFSERLREL
jgi:predicted ATPase